MKKSIEWKTPKVYQRGWDRIFRTNPSKKPKGYCIKLKDKHEFLLKKEEKFQWFSGIFKEYRCTGCDKKKLVFLKDNI